MQERPDRLADFYATWSEKTTSEINFDLLASKRKVDVILNGIPETLRKEIRTIIDFGCGYGGILGAINEQIKLDSGIGIDFSEAAIHIAQKKFTRDNLKFVSLSSLEVEKSIHVIKTIAPHQVDCILLIDLLEHIPNCKTLIQQLARLTKYFIIKLPIESAYFDDYILPKEYPSSKHSNGHLREFNVNTVHYFIRKLGLTPLHEETYIYHIDDIFPPPANDLTKSKKIKRMLLKNFKWISMHLLPRKIFLRVIGGGGYYCLASFNEAHILEP